MLTLEGGEGNAKAGGQESCSGRECGMGCGFVGDRQGYVSAPIRQRGSRIKVHPPENKKK